MRAFVAVMFICACNHGNDMAMATDMAMMPDLGGPDMAASPGPSCGEIATCAFMCGQDVTCYQGCVAGASPQTLLTLGNLLVCAGTNCSSSLGLGGADAGGLDQVGLFKCLFQKCPQQLSMCGGLFGTN
jgi:hypothetical protein